MAHHHNRGEPAADYGRAFALGIALNLGFVVVEAAAGFFGHSLALLADAGHNLSDVLALFLAWGAGYLSRLKPSDRRTYGLRRSTIFAALANGLVLLAAIAGIGWEAIRRLGEPEPVQAALVIWIALAGLVINAGTAWLFAAGRERDLNIRAAFLHMAGDAAVSLGVAIAGIAILFTGALWLDPAISLAIVFAIAFGTWGLLRDSVDLALDAVPRGIDREAVENYLRGLPGITEVHDLHIWGMSTTEVALTVHLVKPDAKLDDRMLGGIAEELCDRFGIGHATIQLETGDPVHPCACTLESSLG